MNACIDMVCSSKVSAMTHSRGSEFCVPSYDEYTILRESFFAVGNEPDASKKMYEWKRSLYKTRAAFWRCGFHGLRAAYHLSFRCR